jgi:hypothetical protein
MQAEVDAELQAAGGSGMTGFDLTDTIQPNSDQLDACDLLGGPQTFTIEDVSKGNAEQPVNLHLAGFPRPWRPGKSMRRVLVACWGPDAKTYIGRRVTLYCDPSVVFGGQAVGGTRIAALSHIDKPKQVPLLVSRGKSAIFVVKPLANDAPAPAQVPTYMADARAAKTLDEWRDVWQRADAAGHLNDALKAELTPIGAALKAKVDEPAEPTPDGLQ